MARRDLVQEIQQLVGDAGLEVTDPGDGWPALGIVRTVDDTIPVALFVGTVGLSHRGRDEVERRFQNPGQDRPIQIPAGRLPLLLGLWRQDQHLAPIAPVLVSADAHRRQARMTRFSVFVGVDALSVAAATGWYEGENSAGELVRCFHPALLPAHVEATRLRVGLAPDRARLAVASSSLAAQDDPERERRITTSLVRAARFARMVRDAYEERCAMCSLGLGLVESAHIYPASAPGSWDEVWNGVALCGNHHRAFDRHLIWVNPTSLHIRVRPDVSAARTINQAHDWFVGSIADVLTVPQGVGVRPQAQTFERRYAHYGDSYDWVN